MVTVAGVGAGVGVGVTVRVGVAVGVAVAVAVDPLPDPPRDEERDPAEANPPLRTAPASAAPPAVKNCRRVANPDLTDLMLLLGIFQKHDGKRHGFARCRARP